MLRHWWHELHLSLWNWARHSMSEHSASCIRPVSHYRGSSTLSWCETIRSMILDHVIFQVLSCTVFCTTVFTGLPFTPSVELLMCSKHTPVVESFVAIVTIEPCREPGPRQWWSSTAPPYSSPSRICIAVRCVRGVPRISSRKLWEIVPRVFLLHQSYLMLLQASFLFQLWGVWEDGTDQTLGRWYCQTFSFGQDPLRSSLILITHLDFKDTVVRHKNSMLNRQVKHRHLVKIWQDQAKG